MNLTKKETNVNIPKKIISEIIPNNIKDMKEFHNQNLKVNILTINIVEGKSLNSRWKDKMQVINFIYNENLFVAIDNLPNVEHNEDEWIGKSYQEGQTIEAYFKISCNYLWIKNSSN